MLFTSPPRLKLTRQRISGRAGYIQSSARSWHKYAGHCRYQQLSAAIAFSSPPAVKISAARPPLFVSMMLSLPVNIYNAWRFATMHAEFPQLFLRPLFPRRPLGVATGQGAAFSARRARQPPRHIRARRWRGGDGKMPSMMPLF